MISRIIFICVLTTYNSAFNTDKLRPYAILSKPECQANKVYQKDDVTCFCNKYGRWPHKNCSLVFDEQAACKPNSFVQVNCNVCRCSETGTIQREFCTNHVCTADPEEKIVFRRFNTKTKCDLNHWYFINSCRLCYCLTRDNLLCAAKMNPKELQIGKYNVSDCGTDWLNDINKLLSSVNPLRIGEKSNQANQADIETMGSQVIIKVQTTPKSESPKDSPETINLNQENDEDQNVKIARNDDRSDENDLDSSSESNSEEKVEEGKAIARIAGNTVMPFQNYEENDNNNSYDAESDKTERGNESGSKKQSEEEDVSKEIEPALDIDKKVPKILKNGIDQKSDESLFKLSLPGMLGKVFNFGIRKSMVSITDSNCVPGSTLTVDCNTCFCLTNGKLLCTKKICK